MDLRVNLAIYLNVNSTTTTDPDACILWTGIVQPRGYGRVENRWTFLTGEQYAHRLAYAYHIGTLWPGHIVIHTCMNKSCINPRHLLQVENCDNNLYRDSDPRIIAGVGASKLRAKDIRLIRSLKGVISGHKIARRYGVDPSTINKILNGQSWKRIQ